MKLPEDVISLMKKVATAGGDIYVVGGAVRDMLMGREVKDWDLTTNLTPEQIQKIFPNNSFYNNLYGMVGVVIDKQVYEVTTFRTENEYDDNRHPTKVAWGKSLEEDVQRRDFTINSLAINLEGEVFDYYGGEKDLKLKIIKTVGNADDRFGEDALRMLRAIRIATQIGFLIEEKTFESIRNNASKIQNISGERIREELFLILKSQYATDGIKLLKNSGLLKEIMPEILLGVDMEQKGHHVYDVWTHSLEALRNCESDDPITRLATLLHDVGKPASMRIINGERTFHNHEIIGSRIAQKIGKRLKFSNKELDKLFKLVRWHMFTVDDVQTDKAVRRFIRNVTPEYLDDMISLRRSDRIGSGAKETSWRWELFKQRLVEVQKQPFAITDLKINGEDVMKTLNIKPSRKVGEVLKAIFAKVEENPSLNDRELLLKLLEEQN